MFKREANYPTTKQRRRPQQEDRHRHDHPVCRPGGPTECVSASDRLAHPGKPLLLLRHRDRRGGARRDGRALNIPVAAMPHLRVHGLGGLSQESGFRFDQGTAANSGRPPRAQCGRTVNKGSGAAEREASRERETHPPPRSSPGGLQRDGISYPDCLNRACTGGLVRKRRKAAAASACGVRVRRIPE